MLGRNILPEEDEYGRPNELILSYGLWTHRFNANRRIVGKKVRINGHDCLVIGVMPPDFNFPLRRAAAHTPQPYVEFWAPMKAGRIRPIDPQGGLGAVARLGPGVSLIEAQQDLASIGAVLAHEFPATNRDRTFSAGFLWDRTLGKVRPALWFLMGAASLFPIDRLCERCQSPSRTEYRPTARNLSAHSHRSGKVPDYSTTAH
ncbi:MAG TPA: ABC transporter permease [Bryobacteraceae bacterium]|jgi:hypothetical protein|nr:ABC transporter permease [Bryobacteraceae bacterium]